MTPSWSSDKNISVDHIASGIGTGGKDVTKHLCNHVRFCGAISKFDTSRCHQVLTNHSTQLLAPVS